jgi:hypothetical protein
MPLARPPILEPRTLYCDARARNYDTFMTLIRKTLGLPNGSGGFASSLVEVMNSLISGSLASRMHFCDENTAESLLRPQNGGLSKRFERKFEAVDAGYIESHGHGDVCEAYWDSTCPASVYQPLESGYTTVGTNSVPNRTVSRPMLPHNILMRMLDLTPKELSSVRCSTCGVAAGERCHSHSGSPCSEPHLERKLCAIEALEQKKILEANLRAASKYQRAKLQ